METVACPLDAVAWAGDPVDLRAVRPALEGVNSPRTLRNIAAVIDLVRPVAPG
jgi:hypothetical protein